MAIDHRNRTVETAPSKPTGIFCAMLRDPILHVQNGRLPAFATASAQSVPLADKASAAANYPL
jgi:hypothetical protein